MKIRRRFFSLFIFLVVSIIVLPAEGDAQTGIQGDSVRTGRKDALRLFITCDVCDMDFLRTEIPYVNHVRDRLEAQVHALVTTQRTATGGTEHTITLYGEEEFEGLDDTARFVSQQFDSQDDVRRGIARTLQLALVRYILRTPLADRLSVSFSEKMEPTAVADPWDNWVFSASGYTFLNGQRAHTSASLGGGLSANRTTPDWKIRGSASVSYNRDRYTIDTVDYYSYARSHDERLLVVRSLDDHWSIGGWAGVSASSYGNTDFLVDLAPAIEYDLFPYSESTRRQFRILYKPSCDIVRYREQTIYDKIRETLFRESLTFALEVRQPWGSSSLSVTGSHYFHDFSKNSVDVTGVLSLPLVKGLAVNLFASYTFIHDQISLPRQGTTEEEILLQRRQLETSYSYYATFSLSYTFGSIYNNVVNPRFGDSGGGYSISISY